VRQKAESRPEGAENQNESEGERQGGSTARGGGVHEFILPPEVRILSTVMYPIRVIKLTSLPHLSMMKLGCCASPEIGVSVLGHPGGDLHLADSTWLMERIAERCTDNPDVHYRFRRVPGVDRFVPSTWPASCEVLLEPVSERATAGAH